MQALNSPEPEGKSLSLPLKRTTQDPELADRFDQILGEVVEAMEESKLKYAFIGGIASGGLGRPRSTHDIDIFVQPEDAELALRALAKRGFKTEKTDATWLFKGFKENILVDVIFKSKGEIYLDKEMVDRLVTAQFHGKHLKLVAPEDLLIIKSAAHSEATPGHWHDAVALLTHASIDWNYLLGRARRAPRRVLSLLLYAQSNDVWVPNFVIHTLYDTVFSGNEQRPAAPHMPAARAAATGAPASAPATTPVVPPSTGPTLVPIATVTPLAPHPTATHRTYAVAHLRERLAEDVRVGELDVHIEHSGDRLLLRGEVPSHEKRLRIIEIAAELFPECQVENQLRLFPCGAPVESEEIL